MRNVVKNTLLVLGAAIIVVSGLFTLDHLTDRTVFTVLVPGFVFGLILICVAMTVGRGGWRWFG
jgi:membrane protease YdiL (CAAX protease family)